VKIVETATRFAIEWAASHRLEDDAFVVTEGLRQRIIFGYRLRT
jgi:hypothetical protein